MAVCPVIPDGGQKLLLANIYGPRSLKCNSENRGLIKPAPEHTYAVVDRDFLCDCQLDLEHTSVLRKLRTCAGNKSAHLTLHFVVNMGFHKLLHTNRPNLVANVKPNIHKQPQTFQVRIFMLLSKPLDKPTDLLK